MSPCSQCLMYLFIFFFGLCPAEHRGPGQDVREMLPAPTYRGQQQFPGQLLLLHFGNQGNQGAGSPLPGNTHTRTHTFPYLHVHVDRFSQFFLCSVLLLKADDSCYDASPPLQGSRCSSDVVMLGEMMFGSVAMSYKGSTLKIHQIR